MNATFIFVFAFCLVAIFSPGVAAQPKSMVIDEAGSVLATVGGIDFRECIIESGFRDRQVQCARLDVPENREDPEGKQIRLFIVRLPTKNPNPRPDPVLFLAGGPGQAASEGYLHIDKTLTGLAKDRDFYLIDQRGTGFSNFLGCDSPHEQGFLPFQYNPAEIKAFFRECLHTLPGDPRFYTTSIAIRDFEAVRQALGIGRWNLLGGSYGTRVAIHYMRRDPEFIRSAVLDSVVPPELNFGTGIALQSQKILDHLYKRCREDAECHRRFPDLQHQVEGLLSRLADAPIEVQTEDFRTGRIKSYTLTRAHLAILIRLYLYDTRSLALLPPILHRAAAERRYAPLVRASESMMEGMGQMLSPGMHQSVVCTEDVPLYKLDHNLVEKTRDTYLGTEFLDSLKTSCSVWPRGVMDEDFKEPLKSDIPTLLLSGEYDPITPPQYAEQAAKYLSNARHLVLEGQGHPVAGKGCAPSIIADFVDRASPANLKESCLGRLDEAPLFINFNGPTP